MSNQVSKTEAAFRASIVYAQIKGIESSDTEDHIRALITDLRALSEEYGVDFDEAVEASRPEESNSPYNEERAHSEGWGLFETEGGEIQVQRLQEANIFKDDNQAWHFIIKQAIDGSEFHIGFIKHLKEIAPDEHALWVNESSVNRDFTFNTTLTNDRDGAFKRLSIISDSSIN